VQRETNNLTDDCDSLIWSYTADGKYSSSSIYKIISFRGVVPLYIPSVWSLHVPPRIHTFLWLLSKDKLMTKDNLQKRNLNKPLDCVFCKEHETINHIFFDCVVARNVWEKVSEFFGLPPISDYLSVARIWLANTKHAAQNTIYSAVLWSIWKIRNALVFDNQQWICLK
jgi:hypothetical protein